MLIMIFKVDKSHLYLKYSTLTGIFNANPRFFTVFWPIWALNGFWDLPGDQIWDEKYNMTSSKAWYAKQNAFTPNLKSEIAQNPYVQYEN